MTLAQSKSTGIALNVTRTRVTVLAFNLTIISVMLSAIKVDKGGAALQQGLPHLTSLVALFAGFCVTILGLWWLLVSQDQDAEGLSNPWPFTFGSITTYLALSQTTSAFIHEYLIGLKAEVLVANQMLNGPVDFAAGHQVAFVLLMISAAIWFLITYVAPLMTVLKGPLAGQRSWIFIVYYLAIQVPIFWVYAEVWQLSLRVEQAETSIVTLFALQFIQPLLWFR